MPALNKNQRDKEPDCRDEDPSGKQKEDAPVRQYDRQRENQPAKTNR